MVVLISVYVVVLLLVIAYVIINAFHLINFRLKYKGDLSLLLLGVYLAIVISILGGSVILGLFNYYNFT